MHGRPDDVVRALHATGAALGRAPEPVPEADPWEERDPLDTDRSLTVVFPGLPDLRVRPHDDGVDAVHFGNYVTLDVRPRRP